MFRVDYVAANGQRGRYHCEVEADSVEEVRDMCVKEMNDVMSWIKQTDMSELSHLVIVELIALDVLRVEAQRPPPKGANDV